MADLGVARPHELLARVPGKIETAGVPHVGRSGLDEHAQAKRSRTTQKVEGAETPSAVEPEELRQVVEELNREGAKWRLRFEVDDSFGGIVVHVVDQETGEVLRTIPPSAALRLRDNLASGRGVVLDEQS